MTSKDLVKRQPVGLSVVAAREADVTHLLRVLRDAGQHVDVLGGQKSVDDPDLWMVNVRVLGRPAVRKPNVPLHRYVPAWVWAAVLTILVVLIGGGGWLVWVLVSAALAHAGEIAVVGVLVAMILGGGGCCLVAAAGSHRH